MEKKGMWFNMSGGSLGYAGSYINDNVFGYVLDVHYSNINNHEQCQLARSMNPMSDREVSELLFDISCLLHSCEWCKSCDIGEDTYKEHLKQFKQKWFKRSDTDRIEGYKKDLQAYYESLVAELERSV